MPLARHQRADREDVAGRSARAGAARRIVGAGHHDLDAVAIDAEVRSEPFGGRLAGHDDPREPWQQAFLDAEQRSAVALSEAVSRAVG